MVRAVLRPVTTLLFFRADEPPGFLPFSPALWRHWQFRGRHEECLPGNSDSHKDPNRDILQDDEAALVFERFSVHSSGPNCSLTIFAPIPVCVLFTHE